MTRAFPVSRCLSATGIGFLGILCPPGNSAFLAVGLPRHIGGDTDGVSTFHTSETRPGWVPSLLRDGGARTAGLSSPAAACRFSAASPVPRSRVPSPGLPMSKHSRIHLRSPVRSSPRVWPPDGAGTLGLLPQASDPAVTSDARRGGDRPSSTDPELHNRHRPILQSVRSLISCDLVSHASPLTDVGRGTIRRWFQSGVERHWR